MNALDSAPHRTDEICMKDDDSYGSAQTRSIEPHLWEENAGVGQDLPVPDSANPADPKCSIALISLELENPRTQPCSMQTRRLDSVSMIRDICNHCTEVINSTRYRSRRWCSHNERAAAHGCLCTALHSV
jgi:hypothetical protein